MKRVLIIGGGYAGVKAGKTLHKAFKKNDDVEITLVDAHGFHTMMTELHEVAAFRTEPDSIRIDLKKIFAGRKVNVVTDTITNIDFDKKIAKSEEAEFPFDYIILGTGAEPNYFGIDGIEENSFKLWSYEDAVLLREHIESMFAKAGRSNDPEKRKRLLTFAVVGSGFTGVEMAGELGSAKKQLCKEYGVDEKEVSIYNIEAMDRILNTLESDKQIAKVENKFKKLGVTLMKNSPIVKADENSFTIKDGTKIETNTLIWTAGIKSTTFSSNLGLETGKSGRVVVNEHLQAKDKDFVYFIGDNTWYEDEDGPLPQIVEAAEATGHTAGANVAAAIKGEELHSHKQKYNGFMVSIGSRYCVSDNNGLRLSGWFSMLVKHMINMFYQFMVGGVRQLWAYVGHQFFRVKNRRSFVGGHFAKSSLNIWRLPLRIWLGYMWLVEGVVKISEGWLNSPKIVSTVNYLYNAAEAAKAVVTTDAVAETVVEVAPAAAAATDAVTAATGEVVAEAAPVVADAVTAATGEAVAEVAPVVADTVTAATGEVATEVVDAVAPVVDAVGDTVADAAFQIPSFIQWIVDKKPAGYGDALMDAPKFMVDIMNMDFFVNNEVLIQSIMVFAEIAIGLCLIAGLFTFITSAMSVFIGIGIMFTGMADATMVWYMTTGIALVQGSGSTFGLDYYVMPVIKNWWSNTKFAKKSYLYFD